MKRFRSGRSRPSYRSSRRGTRGIIITRGGIRF